jgi:leucyl/phenylalanyl-tRNA--protein transferase
VLRRSTWTTTVDRDFAAVVEGCRRSPSWITDAMRDGFVELHRSGYAHSVEVWAEDELVGGAFGVLIGKVFAGESMFRRRDEASRTAFIDLVRRLEDAGAVLFDLQYRAEHFIRLGVRDISRREYLTRLSELRDQPAHLPPERRRVSELAS